MKNYIVRPEGDAFKRESTFKDSVSIDMKTSLFGYMKKRGFIEMGIKHDQIVDNVATRIVTADTEAAGEAAVEMIGTGTFLCGGKEYSVRLKMFNTSCSVQIQVMGEKEESDDFRAKMKITTAEYFGDIVLEFGNKVCDDNPDLDNNEEYIPKQLDQEIERLEQMKGTTANNPAKQKKSKGYEKKPSQSKQSCEQCNTQSKNEQELKKHIQLFMKTMT